MPSPARIFWLTLVLLAALGAMAVLLDWPTPARLAQKRLDYAAMLVNGRDKGFDPATVRRAKDPEAAFAQLRARFGGSPATAKALDLAQARYESLSENASRNVFGLCLAVTACALAGAGLARVLAAHRKAAKG